MAVHEQDMSKVLAPDDLVPEAWYQVRVKSVEEVTDENTGENRVLLGLSIQQPEDMIGTPLRDNPSLDNPMGLRTLKAYYKAANYQPGPEGHDPTNLLDAEFWVKVVHNKDKKTDRVYSNVAFWSIRSLQAGKGK